jgi:hypothetical protein
VIECYESGVYRSGSEGRTDEDFDKSMALWRRYADIR